MKRQYTATWDNGHEYGEFDFYSEYRANSKANIKDAKEESRRKYGYEKTITSTRLKDSW